MIHNSEEIRTRIAIIRKNLKDEVRFYERSKKSKIPFKVEIYLEALSLRIVEHIEAVTYLYDNNLIIPAFALIRSNFESLALLDVVVSSIEKSLSENKLDQLLNGQLDSMLLGTRMGNERIQAISVLTQIDKMDKKFEGLRQIYNSFSEFVHPNHDGVLGGYTNIYPGEHKTIIEPQLSKSDKQAKSSFNFTAAQLDILENLSNYIYQHMNSFTCLCEQDI